MAEKGLRPKEAAIESMREVTGAIIAIELVLCSGVRPGCLSRRPRRSALPAVRRHRHDRGGHLRRGGADADARLCALLLKPSHGESRIFRPFNQGFAWLVSQYNNGVRWVAHHAVLAFAASPRHRLHRRC